MRTETTDGRMRRERQRPAGNDHDRHQPLIAAARRGARSAGEPLGESVRRPLESQFGHDFRNVRIHHDAEAGSAARELAAHAYTLGEDVVFGDGGYAPETSDGARMLAHELTHVVQQSHRTPSADAQSGRVLDSDDPSELAAARAAESIVVGGNVASQGVGTIADSSGPIGGAVVQRWGWDDFVDDVSSVGSSVVSGAESVGSGLESAGSAVYSGYEKATDFRGMANGLNTGVDWLEDKSKAASQAVVDSASGIPVVEQLAEGAAWFNNATTDLTGGVVKGAGDLASGVLGGVAHPIDAVSNWQGMTEHLGAGIPFLGTMLKGGHGLYDLAVHGGGEYGNSFTDLANHVFNPLQQAEDDSKYAGALGKGIVAPGEEAQGGGWQRWIDNPLEAASRALTNVAPVVMGVGEATAPGAAADASSAAARTADATTAAASTADASTAGAPGAGAGPQSIQEMLDDALRNAQGVNDGSRPLTTEGSGRYAPVVEAGDSAPGAGTGGSGAAPAVAPTASGPGMVSRIGNWFKGLVDSGGGESKPSPAAAGESDSDVADRYLRQLQAKGQAGTDAELSAPKVATPADQGYGNRPMRHMDPNSLGARRRGR